MFLFLVLILFINVWKVSKENVFFFFSEIVLNTEKKFPEELLVFLFLQSHFQV